MKKNLLALCSAALFAAAAPATAGVLYATNNFDLFTLNQADGVASLVGSLTSTTSNRNVIDMAAAGSQLYGLVQEQVPVGTTGSFTVQTRLALVDSTNAAMTDLPLISGIVTTSGPSRRIDTIAYHAGTMYGINNGPNRSLYTIDTITGAATLVGALPSVSNQSLQYRSLSFGAGGVLYAALNIIGAGNNLVESQLVSIDTATGAQTVIGGLAGAVLGDMAFDVDNGILFGGGFATTSAANSTDALLYAIDSGITPQATLRGGQGFGLWSGLAVAPAAAAVPEPGTLLLAGLAMVGLMAGQRRRQARPGA